MSIHGTALQELGPMFSSRKLTPEEFEAFALANTDLIMEQEADGRVKFMSPVGEKSGNRENQFIADLTIYERTHSGKSFSSSTGFRLPDGSTKSPDAAYVSEEKLSRISAAEYARFLPLVPDFIVEVLCPSDPVSTLEAKMRETWIGNSVKLAWLADVDTDKLWIYRANHSVELVSPLDRTVTGEEVLPGFSFDLTILQ